MYIQYYWGFRNLSIAHHSKQSTTFSAQDPQNSIAKCNMTQRHTSGIYPLACPFTVSDSVQLYSMWDLQWTECTERVFSGSTYPSTNYHSTHATYSTDIRCWHVRRCAKGRRLIKYYQMVQSRKIRWAGRAARVGKKRYAYRVLVGELKEKRTRARPRHRRNVILKWV